MNYDVAVLGAGPGGYEAAIRSSQYGLKTVLIEAKELGGTCLNRGCIPTKALLHGAEFYDEAKNSAEYGISFENIHLDYAKLVEYKEKVVSYLRNGVEGLERAYGVDVIQGFGVLKGNNEIDVDGMIVKADNIIIATGSSPFLPGISGINNKSVITSDEVLSMKECPERLVIIGGGVIGIEFAALYSSLGKDVTVVEMQDVILSELDQEIVERTTKFLNKKGVNIITGAKVTAIEEESEVVVYYEESGQQRSATGDICIVSVGRMAKIDGIGLEKAGVQQNGKFIEVDDMLRTNIPNIYAIGDVTGWMP